MNNAGKQLDLALSEFLSACGREYEFPAAAPVELLTTEEHKLLDALAVEEVNCADKIRLISEDKDWNDSYSIVIFGLRLAVIGVRKMTPGFYRTGLVAFVGGAPAIDRRDTLGALAVLENCADRLTLSFQSEIEQVAQFTNSSQLQGTLSGYFERQSYMRSVQTMGLVEVGEGESFTFRAKCLA